MKVTIVIPAYNVEDYICETLLHIQNQTHKDFECVIIDDRCTDSTIDLVINQFCKRDPRFKVLVNLTTGQPQYSYVHNFAYQYASTEYTIHLDADDIPCDNMVETLLSYMVNNQNVDACGCRINILELCNNLWCKQETPYYETSNPSQFLFHYPSRWEDEEFNVFPTYRIVKNGCMVPNQAIIFKTEKIKNLMQSGIKFYDDQPFADYIFWLTVVANGTVVKKIDAPLLYWREHNRSVSHNINYQVSWEDPVKLYIFYYARFLCILKSRQIDNTVLQEDYNNTKVVLRDALSVIRSTGQENAIPDIFKDYSILE